MTHEILVIPSGNMEHECEINLKELHLRHDKHKEGGRKLLYVFARLPCVLLFPHSKITSAVASSSSTNSNQLGQVCYESGINTTNDTAETVNNIV
ncbi:hypothetical protein F8M41_013805 [Gigaspora margarita]|uniref:Uncharacterized protein n=1 Tax=Gigaspora margarita TaxID=4874 RepID=A0A8H4ASC6_GIGMA|nr:hypothetical protein F8M41_013805 [Gigaspora margarita]